MAKAERPFIVLWREWLADSDEHWSTKLAGHTMALRMNTAGKGCECSLEDLARRSGMSISQAKRARRVLVAHKWVTSTVGGGRGNTNVYDARKPGLTEPDLAEQRGPAKPGSRAETGPDRTRSEQKGGLSVTERGPETNRKGASLTPEVVTTEVENREQGTAAAPERRQRERDPIWDAVMEACGLDSTQMTGSARGAANRACSELRGVGATPALIAARAAAHRQQWPKMSLTPTSLAKNWAQLAATPANVAHTPAAAERWLASRGAAT